MPTLTTDDVERLLSTPTPEARVEAATKIARLHTGSVLSPSEKTLAEAIFRTMVRDADAHVRAALAEHLKDNPTVPHDVALALARDVEQVAVPMLHYSLVLNDEDLIELVRTRPAAFQTAIARRETVSEAVADSLVSHGDETVAATLVRNPGADVTDRVGAKIIDLFSGREMVMDGLAQRPRLSIALAERLVTLVSENIRIQLANAYDLPNPYAERLMNLSREKATMELLINDATPLEVDRFVRQLHTKGRLTPSIVMRGLCMGEISFFHAALARLCGIPTDNAVTLIHDSGNLGLRSVCKVAGLADAMADTIRIVFEAGRGAGTGPKADPTRFQQRVIASFRDHLGRRDVDNLEALLALLDVTDYSLPKHTRTAAAG